MKRNVGLYMTKNPKAINEELNVSEVFQKFNEFETSHLFVLNKRKEMIGVISKEDLLIHTISILNEASGKTYARFMQSGSKASDIMTKDFVRVSKNDSMDLAIEILLQNKFHSLPVVEQGKAVGILTSSDLLKAYYEELG